MKINFGDDTDDFFIFICGAFRRQYIGVYDSLYTCFAKDKQIKCKNAA